MDAGLFIPTFILGSVVQIFGMFMTSLCKVFWQLVLAQGICTGVGSGSRCSSFHRICVRMKFLMVAQYSLLRQWPLSQHISRNIEDSPLRLCLLATPSGGMVYPILVRQLLPKIGFAWTIRALAFVNLTLLGVCLAFLRPRLPPRKAGPIVEWTAFTEAPYVCLLIAMSFVFGGLFFHTTTLHLLGATYCT